MAIQINTRDSINNASMVAPATTEVASLQLRPISLGSLEILRQIGNPLATGEELADIDTHTVAEFVWVHAAPMDFVVDTAYNRPSQVAKEVALFCLGVSPADIKAITSVLASDQRAVQSASAIPIPDSDTDSPNAPTHP